MQKIAQAFHSDRAGISVVDFLADELPLSKSRIKEAMQKGAVWLHREDCEPERVRRAKEMVKLGDDIHIYYDEDFLAIQLPPLRLIDMQEQFSVWHKPEGVLQEVNLYGDHLALERIIERDIPRELDCYFVDPNNGEVTGLMVVAHSEVFAAALEKQAEQALIEKDYRVTVKGKLADDANVQVNNINYPVQTLKYHAYNNSSLVRVKKAQLLELQLLSLLADLGYPTSEDEQLQCCHIAFLHPKTQKKLSFNL